MSFYSNPFNIGKMKSRILVFAICVAFSNICFGGPNNIAPLAKVTVSTEARAETAAQFLTDGIIGIDGKGEWACQARGSGGNIRLPWVQFDWDTPQWIEKIVIFDRPSLSENITGARILFSDGTSEWARQIPLDGTGIAISFTPKKTKWVRIVATDGIGGELGFSEIEIYPSAEQFTDYVGLVDPYIETSKGRYEYFITGSTPFGMVTSAPLTRNKHQHGGGYNYNDKEVLGFPQIHTWMMTGIEVMPATVNQNPAMGRKSWKSAFNHDDEIVQPGYHRIMLQQNKIWVEQTATERVSYYRFTYTQPSDARIIVDLGSEVFSCSSSEKADITKINNQDIEGLFHSTKRYWGGPSDIPVFFVIQFDKPFKSLNAWPGNGEPQIDVAKASGDGLTIAAEYELNAGDQVQMKIGISYTSIENARNNLNAECTTWNFDEVRAQTQGIWNTWLSKIDVKGGESKQRVKFYTDLWHVLLGRQKITDVSGDYPDRTEIVARRGFQGAANDATFKIKSVPKDKNGKPQFDMYLSDAFWLTQWNLNVLWSLAWPEVIDDMTASLIEYANNGKLLPRGPFGGGYSFIMTGNPAASLITAAYMKGLLQKSDPLHAFNHVKYNQMPGGMIGEGYKPNAEFYIKNGYWPGNAGITIEINFQDYATSQMAAKLGKTEDFKYFEKRSHSWQTCFDPERKLLFPRNDKGEFMHFDPLDGKGWNEGNAWQSSFGLSHDIPLLASKMGGNDSLSHKLNYAFEMSRTSDYLSSYGSGYVNYANQPGLSNAHVFSYVKAPWLTQYWVRRVKEQTYGATIPDLGYGGHDEDEGQMGGVSALMAIGLFDVMGGATLKPVYEITSPVFDEVTITLNPKYYKGKTFSIRTYNNSRENCYIQSAKLNGVIHNDFWFDHEAFANGGSLDIWLGSEPNKNWGVTGLPPAYK